MRTASSRSLRFLEDMLIQHDDGIRAEDEFAVVRHSPFRGQGAIRIREGVSPG